MIPHIPAMSNTDARSAILATIALEVLRKGPSLPAPIQFIRDVDYVEVPPAHIAADAMRKGRDHG